MAPSPSRDGFWHRTLPGAMAKYCPELTRLAGCLCGVDNAEDVIHTVVVVLLSTDCDPDDNSYHPQPGIRDVRAFLGGAVWNASLQFLRAKRTRLRHLTTSSDAVERAAAISHGDIDLAIDLKHAMRRVPAPELDVINLRYVELYSVAETAYRLGVSEGLVKSRSHFARLLFQKVWGPLTPSRRRGTTGRSVASKKEPT
jgi:RNA polymerase sigma factor (sigma-70 family)